MKRKWILLSLSAMALSAAAVGRLAAADEAAPATSATTAPADDENNPPRTERPRYMGEGYRGRFGGLPPSTRPVGTEKWGEIDKFLQQNSPKRWAKLQDIPEERKNRIRGVVARRYDAFQDLKETDPRMYELKLKRLPIEDEIFDLGWQLNHGKPADKAAVQAKLKQQVRALIDSRMDERKLRLQEWGEHMDAEKKKLEADESNVDRMVESNLKMIEGKAWPPMDFLGTIAGPGPGQGQRPGFMRPDRDNREFAPASQPTEH